MVTQLPLHTLPLWQVVSSLRTKLNIFDIGAVSEQLRDAFRVEHDALLEDVQYLHECLQAGPQGI